MPAFLKSGIVVMLISGFGMHRDIYKYTYLGNTPKIQGIQETWEGRGGQTGKNTELWKYKVPHIPQMFLKTVWSTGKWKWRTLKYISEWFCSSNEFLLPGFWLRLRVPSTKALLFYGLKAWTTMLTARQLSVQMLYNTILFVQVCVTNVPQHAILSSHLTQPGLWSHAGRRCAP